MKACLVAALLAVVVSSLAFAAGGESHSKKKKKPDYWLSRMGQESLPPKAAPSAVNQNGSPAVEVPVEQRISPEGMQRLQKAIEETRKAKLNKQGGK